MHQCEADKEYVLLAAPSFQLVILQIPQRIAASSQSTSRHESARTRLSSL
jgi:hypothetical protein